MRGRWTAIPAQEHRGGKITAGRVTPLDPPLPCDTPDSQPFGDAVPHHCPAEISGTHVEVLAKLALTYVLDTDFCASLRQSGTPEGLRRAKIPGAEAQEPIGRAPPRPPTRPGYRLLV